MNRKTNLNLPLCLLFWVGLRPVILAKRHQIGWQPLTGRRVRSFERPRLRSRPTVTNNPQPVGRAGGGQRAVSSGSAPTCHGPFRRLPPEARRWNSPDLGGTAAAQCVRCVCVRARLLDPLHWKVQEGSNPNFGIMPMPTQALDFHSLIAKVGSPNSIYTNHYKNNLKYYVS